MRTTNLIRLLQYSLPFLVLALVIVLGFVLFLMRKMFTRHLGPREEPSGQRVSDDPAFAITAFQSVIQKLREQEKELEQLHQAERQRAAESARLSDSITRSMPTGLVMVNSARLIMTCNPAAQATLGLANPLYQRYMDLLGSENPLAEMIEDCLCRGTTFQREEVDYRTPAGEVRRLGVSVSPVKRGDGGITGATCLLTDLTEVTALQKQMRLRESLAKLGEMSAGIAHEFKNSLATITGYAQMIRSEAGDSELGQHAQKILNEARSLARVMADFLNYAKPVRFEPRTVSSRELIEAAGNEVRVAAPGARFTIEGVYEAVQGDASLLRQVFLNLLRNAGESVACRGTEGCVVVRGEVEAGSHRTQKIIVEDNGAGIAAENVDKIFLPFFTTKEGGTGLGLAIVQKIVLSHNGSIEARASSRGTAFIVRLPVGE